MKRALLLGLSCTALLVAACAPSLSAPPSPVITAPPGRVGDPFKANLQVTRAVDALGRAYNVVQFSTGTAAVTGGTLFLAGSSLAVNTSSCAIDGAGLRCTIPPLKAQAVYALPVRGLTGVAASYFRPDDAVPYTLGAKP